MAKASLGRTVESSERQSKRKVKERQSWESAEKAVPLGTQRIQGSNYT